jgi:hypothetical protein
MLSVRKIRPEVGAHISVTMMIDDYAVALVNCGKSVGNLNGHQTFSGRRTATTE